jgi:hypothetical protein
VDVASAQQGYIAWANAQAAAGLLPPHEDWNADMGMIKVNGK